MALDNSLKHHFQLAMPGLAGEYYGNTISYVCEQNEDDAMGFMVNRPMDMTVADLLEQLGIGAVATLHQPVMEGGPVKRERGSFCTPMKCNSTQASSSATDWF
jgi:putative transcriptional regulator